MSSNYSLADFDVSSEPLIGYTDAGTIFESILNDKSDLQGLIAALGGIDKRRALCSLKRVFGEVKND